MKKLLVSSLLIKAQVAAFTRKDGSMVQAHDSGKMAAAPPLSTHHNALRSSSKDGDLDHWHNQVAADHMKDGDHKALSSTLRSMDTAARDHVLEHVHPDHHAALGFPTINHDRSMKGYAAKFPAKVTKPKAAKPLHHSDLEEGDELVDDKGQKHEYQSTKPGVGRKMIETRAGYSYPTESDGTVKGFKKTGRNNVTGSGHKPI